uniref:Uncharacterized protein n=1 Tax=Strombidinopsis acuminata TaxID=141414 RepID=A0A7S3X8T9_9SPIT
MVEPLDAQGLEVSLSDWEPDDFSRSLGHSDFGADSMISNGSEVLDSIIEGYEKYKVQVELLRACLKEAELERDDARRKAAAAIPQPSQPPPEQVRSPLWHFIVLLGMVVLVAGAGTYHQHRQVIHYRSVVENLQEEHSELQAMYKHVASANSTCHEQLDREIQQCSTATFFSPSAYGIGPIQVVMTMADFIIQTGRRFLRPRHVGKIAMA